MFRTTVARQATPFSCDPPLPVSDDRASVILSEERPFAPANRDMFFTYFHPDWQQSPPPVVPRGPELTEQETRDNLLAFLQRRFPSAPDRVQEAMAIFADIVARQKFPDPTLRAALAALTGTLGEPAIEYLLYWTPVTLVQFGIDLDPTTGLPARVGMASVRPDGTRYIVIDRRYRFNPFGSLSALLVHEALHTGSDEDTGGQPEEAIASAVEALVYMEMLLTDPSLALLPDPLTRGYSNPLALARLNSGLAGTDRLTLFVPNSAINIDPLAIEPLTEFYGYYARYSTPPNDPDFTQRTTEGNWLLWRILERLAARAEPGLDAEGMNFDEGALDLVDRHQDVLSPAQLIAVASFLELDFPCD